MTQEQLNQLGKTLKTHKKGRMQTLFPVVSVTEEE